MSLPLEKVLKIAYGISSDIAAQIFPSSDSEDSEKVATIIMLSCFVIADLGNSEKTETTIMLCQITLLLANQRIRLSQCQNFTPVPIAQW